MVDKETTAAGGNFILVTHVAGRNVSMMIQSSYDGYDADFRFSIINVIFFRFSEIFLWIYLLSIIQSTRKTNKYNRAIQIYFRNKSDQVEFAMGLGELGVKIAFEALDYWLGVRDCPELEIGFL